MITKIENEHGLCADKLNHKICAYYNNGAPCKIPDYETCLDMVTGKSYIFIEVKDE